MHFNKLYFHLRYHLCVHMQFALSNDYIGNSLLFFSKIFACQKYGRFDAAVRFREVQIPNLPVNLCNAPEKCCHTTLWMQNSFLWLKYIDDFEEIQVLTELFKKVKKKLDNFFEQCSEPL